MLICKDRGRRSTPKMSMHAICMALELLPDFAATLHHTGPGIALAWLQRFQRVRFCIGERAHLHHPWRLPLPATEIQPSCMLFASARLIEATFAPGTTGSVNHAPAD